MEALGLAAVQYNYFHRYLDDASYTRPSPIISTSIRELLHKLAADKRFDGIFKQPGFDNIDPLFERYEDLVLEYWNAWDLVDPKKQFEESQEVAVALLIATVPPSTHAYNFFICHLLTTSHAVRILLPFIPVDFHLSLVRQWWLLVLAVYIAECRPKIDPDNVLPPAKHASWSYVVDRSLNSPWSTDAHYVKGELTLLDDELTVQASADHVCVAIRAIKEAAETWGDVHRRYLAAAITFVDNFSGWTH